MIIRIFKIVISADMNDISVFLKPLHIGKMKMTYMFFRSVCHKKNFLCHAPYLHFSAYASRWTALLSGLFSVSREVRRLMAIAYAEKAHLIKFIPQPREKAQIFYAAIFLATSVTEVTSRRHIGFALRYWKTNRNIRDPTAYDATLHILRAFRESRITPPVGQRSHRFHHAFASPPSFLATYVLPSHRLDWIRRERTKRRIPKRR